MTVIAAAFQDGSDYAIAADSQGEVDGERITGIVKVHRWGPVLLGGWGTSIQVHRGRRWLLGCQPPTSRTELEAGIALMHAALCTHVGTPGNAEVANVGAGFLFVGPWGILRMDYAGAVHDAGRQAAGGSGGLVATGAMWVLGRAFGPPDPRARVLLGVEAAIALDTGCGGDVVVLTGPT